MKKLLALTIIGASLFALVSCANTQTASDTAATAAQTTQAVRTTSTVQTTAAAQTTRITKVTGITADPSATTTDNATVTYDDNGNIIKKEYFKSDGTLYYYSLFEYYPNGNLKVQSNYDFSGKLEEKFEFYETGEDLSISVYLLGVIMRYTEYSISGNTVRSQEYEKGILRVDNVFKDSSKQTYEKVTYYNEDGSLKEYIVYEDTRTVNYNPDGTINFYTIGNTSYYASGKKYKETTPRENNIAITYYYNEDGSLNKYIKAEYSFETIKTTVYDADNNIISVKEDPAFTPD